MFWEVRFMSEIFKMWFSIEIIHHILSSVANWFLVFCNNFHQQTSINKQKPSSVKKNILRFLQNSVMSVQHIFHQQTKIEKLSINFPWVEKTQHSINQSNICSRCDSFDWCCCLAEHIIFFFQNSVQKHIIWFLFVWWQNHSSI